MKKVNSKLTGLIRAVEVEREKLSDAVRIFNDKQMDLWGETVGQALADFDRATEPLIEFVTDVQKRQHDYYDAKSVKWSESPAGEAYQEWLSQWENVTFEGIDPDWSDLEEFDEGRIDGLVDMDAALEELRNCPLSPDGADEDGTDAKTDLA